MLNGINIDTLFKRTSILIYILLLCASHIVAVQPVQAAVMYLVTVSATSSANLQSPTSISTAPVQTYTPSLSPTQTPTTTLVPLPVITLIFPAPTNTARATATPVHIFNIDNTKPSGEVNLFKLSPRMMVLVIVVVCLWILLVGFAIFFIRQFK